MLLSGGVVIDNKAQKFDERNYTCISVVDEGRLSVTNERWIAWLVWKWINSVFEGLTSRPCDKDHGVR